MHFTDDVKEHLIKNSKEDLKLAFSNSTSPKNYTYRFVSYENLILSCLSLAQKELLLALLFVLFSPSTRLKTVHLLCLSCQNIDFLSSLNFPKLLIFSNIFSTTYSVIL